MADLLEQTLTSATLKCLLLDTSTSYTYAPEDEFVSDVPTGAEPGDVSYSRQTLTNVTFNTDDTNDEAHLDADDIVFSSLTTTNDIQTVVIYAQDGFAGGTDDTTPGDDVIVAVYDDDSGDGSGIADLPKATNGSDFTISFDATNGILNLTTPV